MKSVGINIRYLGRIAKLAQKTVKTESSVFMRIIHQEIVARVCKSLLRKQLKKCAMKDIGKVVAHFLNTVFDETDKKTVDSTRQTISTEIKKRYRYVLPNVFWAEQLWPLGLLREICKKVGIQLLMREYCFNTLNGGKKHKRNAIFNPGDIVNLVPIVKSSSPGTFMAEECVEASNILLRQGCIH